MAAPLRFVEPMKASTLAPPSPDDDRWLYEVKFDGFRVLAVKNGATVELWSRNRKPLQARFPEVAAAVRRLPIRSCVLDGEVCALTPQGLSSFQLLQNQEEGAPPIVYYAFDLLWEGARDLRALPLMERKTRLDALLLRATDPIRPSTFFTEDPARVLSRLRKLGGEGAVAKRRDSPYEAGRRSPAWIKIKFVKAQEFVIGGYSLPKAGRKHFGALMLGHYVGTRLVFCGRVGTGFTAKSLKAVYDKMKPLEIDRPKIEAVTQPVPPGWKPAETRWIEPRLVCQVAFTEWTGDGCLHHPSFQGLRDDKAPSGVVREPVHNGR